MLVHMCINASSTNIVCYFLSLLCLILLFWKEPDSHHGEKSRAGFYLLEGCQGAVVRLQIVVCLVLLFIGSFFFFLKMKAIG